MPSRRQRSRPRARTRSRTSKRPTSAEQIDAAARLLREWRQSGVIVQDDEPSFYLHEQRMETPRGRKSRHTLFAAVELSEWGAAGVMGHERTMPGPSGDAQCAALRRRR